jgi:type II secretory pathway component PulF
MPASPATVEQWIALNREIAALVRAGVPLADGLQRTARLGGSPSSELAARLAERMQAGVSLSEALAAEESSLPGAYRAVVDAGLRSGRLPAALEAVAGLAESQQELRSRLRMSLIYPLIVAAFAYALLVGFVVYAVPEFASTYEVMHLSESRSLDLLLRLHRTVRYWGPGLPLLLIAVALVMGVAGRPGTASQPLGPGGLLGLMPGARTVRRKLEQGWFLELLAALLEHNTPLPTALELSAAAVGDRALRTSAVQAAESLRSGRSLSESWPHDSALSPIVQWILTTSPAGPDLTSSLRRSGSLLREQARRQSEWFQVLTPLVAIIVVGGGAVLTYGMAVFGPLVQMLDRLSVEPYL